MLKKLILSSLVIFMHSHAFAAQEVALKTTLGEIVIELNEEKSPITTANFLKYVNAGFYDDTLFHRVIPNFMIQGGGFTDGMVEKKTLFPAIKNEAENGLKNTRGAVAMARTSDINSATSQFFINVVDNKFLDHVSTVNYGYAVFGKVIKGMDVADKIVAQPTTIVPPHRDVPEKAIKIISAKIIPSKAK